VRRPLNAVGVTFTGYWGGLGGKAREGVEDAAAMSGDRRERAMVLSRRRHVRTTRRGAICWLFHLLAIGEGWEGV
jgi:hypothetical protein